MTLLAVWRSAVSDWILSLDLRPKTLRYYEDNLNIFLSWQEGQENPVALEDFGKRDLNRYLRDKPHLSENTKAHYKKSLRKFLAFCQEDHRIEHNPLHNIIIVQPPEAFVYHPTIDDLQKLLAAVDAHWKGPIKNGHVPMRPSEKRFYCLRDRALLAFLIDTGCRISEALGVEKEDVRFEEENPHVILRVQKGGGQRSLPLSRFSVTMLSSYLAVRPKGTANNPVDKRLFLCVDGRAYSYAQASKRHRQYRQEAGIGSCTLHSLRHFTLTLLAEKDIFAAQQMAGHGDPRVTRRYARMRGEHLRDKHREANPLGQVMGGETARPASKRTKRV